MAFISGTSSADVLPLLRGLTVTGGAGHDTFVFVPFGPSGTAVITDFGSIYFAGPVTGGQETNPLGGTGSLASGTVEANLLRGGSALQFRSTVNGLDFGNVSPTGTVTPNTPADDQTPANNLDNITAAHFHDAPAGVSGGVVYGFIGLPFNNVDSDLQIIRHATGVGGTVIGEWDASEGNGSANNLANKIPDLLNNEIYINFHTTAFPTGEIRGQLIRQDSGLDRVDLRLANIGEWETVQLLLRDVGGSAEFTTWFAGQSHTVRFDRVPEAALNAADFVLAGARNDRVHGTRARDDLFGAGGNDRLSGRQDDDRLFGESGDDRLFGDQGDDSLWGGSGDDRLEGGSGDDWLDGGLGDDRLEGGPGADRYVAGGGDDVVRGFNARHGDRVVIDADETFTISGVRGGTLISFADGDSLMLEGVSPNKLGDWLLLV